MVHAHLIFVLKRLLAAGKKGFRISLIQHMRHVHGSFHVGFSVVVVTLYSYIVEYAFVESVEQRQAEQEIRSD